MRDTLSIKSESAFLIGARLISDQTAWSLEDSLEELALLAETAGLEVVGKISQTLHTINPATYIGKGKLQELQDLLTFEPVEVVVFDVDLSPTQQRNLEDALGDIRVVDRTALILDIFAKHARTREGRLQVELAQYEYRLPRLTRQWTHLSRQGVGGVGLRGPGETQLESDRQDIRRRIVHLRRQIEDVRRHRRQYQQHRREAAIPTIAIIGYTNAGKSTLLNALSGAGVLAEDKLFATLDPTTRRVNLPGGREVLFTDTVGFIQNLPTTLVASFRATLEEITAAQLLIHVLDITTSVIMGQRRAVAEILEEVGANDQPIITALNKIDLLQSSQRARELLARFPNSVAISALTGEGIEQLLEKVEHVLAEQMVDVTVKIPYNAGELVSLFHRVGSVDMQQHISDGVEIHGRLPIELIGRYEAYIK